MAMVPAGLIHSAQLEGDIGRAVDRLRNDAVRVRYSLGADSTGDDSIFFRIVLTDEASREDKLAEVTSRVAAILDEEVRPRERWGLLSYFSFRSQSEQSERRDPDWS